MNTADHIEAIAEVVKTTSQHLHEHCTCPRLDPTCPNCTVRIDAAAALDDYGAWIQQGHITLAALEDAARTACSRMKAEDHADCSYCIDLEVELQEALLHVDPSE